VFNTASTPATGATLASTNVDTIMDFITGYDKIQLSKAIFVKLDNNTGNGTGIGALSVDDFYSPTTISTGAVPGARDGTDKILYNKTDGTLWYDPDGNTTSGTAPVKIAILGTTTHPDLQYSDIQIIA
jgi:hypothetical protein